MVLTENQIQALPERIVQRLRDINTEYLESIGTLLRKVDELRPSDIHKLKRMYDYGADMHRISLKLAEVSKQNVAEIYEIFDLVAKDNYASAEIFYKAKGLSYIPYEQNENLQKYVKSLAKTTVDEYINLSQNTAFAIFSKGGKSIAPLFAKNKDKVATSLSDTYTKIMDYAVTKVQLGETDYRSAMREVQKAMANSGIKTYYNGAESVEYASGYYRRLDSAVRQNVLFAVKQCNQNTADMIGEEFGADGYEISYHSNPRPSHADMGGRQYARGEARTVNGVYYPSFEKEAEPLLNEYGCLHFKFSILLGISNPTYNKEQLEQMKADDKKTFMFEGKEYTRYEASQLQRQLESKIRYYKELGVIASKSGDDFLRRDAQSAINKLSMKYSSLSNAAGLPTKTERLSRAGFKKVNSYAEQWSAFIKNTEAADGTVLSRISEHIYDRVRDRNLLKYMTKDNILETLTKPLDITLLRYDENGLPSKQFIGRKISFAVNPNNGTVTSVWKTGESTLKNLTKAADGGIIDGDVIIKTIGAKSATYPTVYYPNTDIQVDFVSGTRPVYPSDHTMAGKGCRTGRKIDDIDRLVDTYGCDANGWQKEKARYEVYDGYGEIRQVELHWYQHRDIGKVEYKVKTRGGYVYIDEWE